MLNLSRAQKKAYKDLFAFFPSHLIMEIPKEFHFAPERTYGDLNLNNAALVCALFGINKDTLMSLDTNAGFGNYHKFESIKERDMFFESHYGETQIYKLEQRIKGDDLHTCYEWITELKKTPGYNSDYQKYGNVDANVWFNKLRKFATEENMLFFNRIPHKSSYFSSRNHGTWVDIVKAFCVVDFIERLLSNKKLVPVT